jgi:hypothetical protein
LNVPVKLSAAYAHALVLSRCRRVRVSLCASLLSHRNLDLNSNALTTLPADVFVGLSYLQ